MQCSLRIIEHTTTTNTRIVSFDQPIEKVCGVLTDAGFWEKVADRFSAADDKVKKFDTTDAGTIVMIRQTISADEIPAQAQKLIKPEAGMTHTFIISPPDDDGTTSIVTIGASDVPASFSAFQKLTAQDEGSIPATNSEFAINVPLPDGKLEERAALYLERVLNAKIVVLAGYVAKQVCTTATFPGRHRRDGHRGEKR